MDWTLELVVVPVSDVDRAKAFYIEQAGFELLVDSSAGPDFRDRPARAAGIGVRDRHRDRDRLDGAGLAARPAPVVSDIEAARDELVGRGTEVGDIFHFGEAGQTPGPIPSVAATRRSCRSRTPTATPGWSRRSSATGASRWSSSTRSLHDRRRPGRVRRWGVRVRGPHRAIPARAPRPLLPDARLVRRGRGCGAGDVPAGMAGARPLRRQRARPRLAVPHRDQRLPRHDPAERPPADLDGDVPRGARGSRRTRTGCSTRSPRATRSPKRSSSPARRSSWRSSPRSRSSRRASARR